MAALIAIGFCFHDWRNALFLTACFCFVTSFGIAIVIVGAMGWLHLWRNA